MECDRQEDAGLAIAKPAPEPEIVVPAYVYTYVTRDFTPQIIKDKESLEIMEIRRNGRFR